MELTFSCVIAALMGTLIIYGILRALKFLAILLLDFFGYDSSWPCVILIFSVLFISFLIIGLNPLN